MATTTIYQLVPIASENVKYPEDAYKVTNETKVVDNVSLLHTDELFIENLWWKCLILTKSDIVVADGVFVAWLFCALSFTPSSLSTSSSSSFSIVVN